VQLQKGFDLAGKKLMLGLPAYDHKVGVKMAISLMRLGQKLMEYGITIHVSSICGCSVVSRARNMIAYEFMQSDCDNLMFIDADMTFDADDVIRLMCWNQDKAIVAGAYEARKEGKIYIVSLDGGNGVNGPQGKVTMDETGLVRAYRVATGFMMIQRRVFDVLKDAHPEWKHKDTNSDHTLYSFFDFKVTPEGYIGEDFLFCDRAREQGLDIWLDPTIKLGHMGIHEFKSDFGNDVLYPSMLAAERTLSTAA
jgi:hypothetical protein